jgi:hypothetical protein
MHGSVIEYILSIECFENADDRWGEVKSNIGFSGHTS